MELELLQVCNNLVLGVSMAAVAEGLALGNKLGLDPKLLSDIFNSSSARCWSSDSYNPCPVQPLSSAMVMSICFNAGFNTCQEAYPLLCKASLLCVQSKPLGMEYML